MRMQLYQLYNNDRLLLSVSMDVPDWLPVRPRLNRFWLRQALRMVLWPLVVVKA